jgi:hypothetical protein
MKKSMTVLAVLMLVCASAWAVEDSKAKMEDNKANRGKQAERYMAAMPVREMFSDMAEQMGKNLPADQRKAFKDLMTKHIDVPAMEKAIKAALMKNFTAEELKALADFYSSPVGKSAMKKMAGYMADLMPVIQTEVMKAQAKANSESQKEPKPAE